MEFGSLSVILLQIVFLHCGQTHDEPGSDSDAPGSERPKPAVSIQPDDQVFRGETVTLRCDIQGGGVFNWQYSWFKDGSSTPVSNEEQYSISSVTESHRGTYTCRGTVRGTSRYSHTSDAVTLTVSERPKPAVSIQPDDQVFRGETVTLRCDIQGGGVFNWQYSWFKDGSSTPVSNEEQYSISSVTESHRGTYTCRGTVRGTSRYSHTSDAVTLTVSERPKPAVSIQPDDQVFRGETVTLRCDIQGGGVFNWQYSWFKDGSSTPVSNEEQYSISSVTESHRGTYTCRGTVRGTSRYSHTSDAVTLTVSERPRAVVSIQPDDQVFSGETVSLRCDIQGGGVSNWQYSWFKDGSSTPVSNEEQYSISSVTESHRGTYTCRGTVRGTSRYSHTSDAVTLTVSALPRATLTVEPRWSPVFTGESVTLKCEIDYYSDWGYQWYKGSSRTAVSQSQTNTFTIRSAADQGQYWCRGERDYRPSSSQLSNTVTLTVTERPRAAVSIQPDDQVFRGETVTLRCDIRGGGISNWQYSWFKDDPYRPVSNEQQYSISSVTKSDIGKYTCRGTETGTLRYSHTSDAVTLTVSALPTATVTVEPKWSPVFTGESVTLKCEIQSHSNWRYQWYKGSSRTAVSQSQTNTFTIRSAADQDQYWCRGQRANRPSSSQRSNNVTLTVKALPRATLTVEPRWSPVFTGESVTLKCEIQSHSNWRYQWYKGSSRTAVSQSQTNTFTIRSAADQDQDQYWCRGERDYRPTSSQPSNTVTLTVTERPKPAVSIQPDDQVFRGETVTLRCDIQGGGVSNWQYSWFKDGSSTHVSNEQQYNISPVTESHRGTYTCRGTERGTSRYSHTSDGVTLTVSALPTATVSVEPRWSPVFTGESVTLKCEIQSHSNWRYQWYKGSSRTAVSQSQTNTFTIRSAADQDQYWCRGQRANRPSSSQRSNNVTLTVKALPRATLTVEPRWSPVFTGESVTLKCEIQSYSNWRYQWYKGSSRTAVSQSLTNTFTIRSAADQDQDQYWCRGERDDRPSSSQPSNTVTLRVKDDFFAFSVSKKHILGPRKHFTLVMSRNLRDRAGSKPNSSESTTMLTSRRNDAATLAAATVPTLPESSCSGLAPREDPGTGERPILLENSSSPAPTAGSSFDDDTPPRWFTAFSEQLDQKTEKTIRILNESLQPIRERLKSLERTFDSRMNNVTELESTLTVHDTRLERLERECCLLKHSNASLVEKLDDLENRSRQCNL
ncbi:hypothetical protein SRHO_G00028600 [Serrasalmus rhombeus]